MQSLLGLGLVRGQEVLVSKDHMAKCRYLMESVPTVRFAATATLDALLRDGVDVQLRAHPLSNSKTTNRLWPTAKQALVIDRASDHWSEFLRDYWTSVWMYGWAACAVSVNRKDSRGKPLPIVITDYSNLSVSVVPTCSEHESTWIFRYNSLPPADSPSLKHLKTKNRSDPNSPLQDIMVFVYHRPDRAGNLKSRAATLLPSLLVMHSANAGQTLASLMRSNPMNVIQPRQQHYDAATFLDALESAGAPGGVGADMPQYAESKQEKLDRVQVFLDMQRSNSTAAEKFVKRKPLMDQQYEMAHSPSLQSPVTTATSVEDMVRLSQPRTLTVPKEHEYKAAASAEEPANLHVVYRMFVDMVAKAWGLPTSAVAALDTKSGADDPNGRMMWRQTLKSLANRSISPVSTLWKIVNTDRTKLLVAVFPDAPDDDILQAAADVQVTINSEPPHQEMKELVMMGSLKEEAWNNYLCRTFNLQPSDLRDKIKPPPLPAKAEDGQTAHPRTVSSTKNK